MRPDQMARIQELSEALADTFIANADPSQWTCGGRPPADLTQQERGDAYWCRKMAMATGGVLKYTLDLVAHHAGGGGKEDDGADLDKIIASAEREAAKALDRIQSGAGKAAFDKRTHGGKA
jgi:hypothetical protein